jgi:dolichol-phosphate mannosyltransferase
LEAPIRSCVVIPTYNERDNLETLVKAIEANRLPEMVVLFVDDSSPDGTADEIRRLSGSRPWIRLLLRDAKKGIGSAYQEGFMRAIESENPEVILEMDADLQHPASLFPRLVETVSGGADVALASRYVPGGGVEGWGLLRRAVSRGANAYARAVLRLKVKDATSGFRAYSRESALDIATADLPAKGFEFQVAALRLLGDTATVVEVPFIFSVRKSGKSKLKFRDTVRFFFAVLRVAMSSSLGSDESKTEIRGTAAAE